MICIILQGDFIWLESAAKGRPTCPIGARILEVRDDKLRVIDDFAQVIILSSSSDTGIVQLMLEASIEIG